MCFIVVTQYSTGDNDRSDVLPLLSSRDHKASAWSVPSTCRGRLLCTVYFPPVTLTKPAKIADELPGSTSTYLSSDAPRRLSIRRFRPVSFCTDEGRPAVPCSPNGHDTTCRYTACQVGMGVCGLKRIGYMILVC
jgi:hypothetical protein